MTNSFILLMGGSGSRMNLGYNKVFTKINEIPLFVYSINSITSCKCDELIIVTKEDEVSFVKEIVEGLNITCPVKYAIGGSERYISVQNGIRLATKDTCFIHDAARPLISVHDINALIESANKYNVGTLYKQVTDTIRNIEGVTIDRSKLRAMSTPQFISSKLRDVILNNNQIITDELALFEGNEEIAFIKETNNNLKVTTKEDLDYIIYLIEGTKEKRIGHSLDYHPFNDKRPLILGGLEIKKHPGLDGHSDADVVYHVVAEAIMGALSLGDLGTLFPDNDPNTLGLDSSIIIKEVMKEAKKQGYKVINIDVMIYCIHPKLKEYKKLMAKNIQELTIAYSVCVKAATLNKHGLIALEEGIGAEALVLLEKE